MNRSERLFLYSEQLTQLCRREITRRYKDTTLGVLWIILTPLIQSLVISFVFVRIVGGSSTLIPTNLFPFIVLSGLTLWNFVSNSLSQAMTAFTGNRDLVINQPIPLILLPTANGLVKLFDFIVETAVLGFLVAIFVHPPTVAWLALIPLTLALTLFSVALCYFFSLVYQILRDVGHVMSFILSIWFWLSPIFYPADIVSSRFRFYNLNPLVHFLAAYRQILLFNQFDSQKLAKIVLISVVAFVVGLLLFRHRQHIIYDLP